MGGRGIADAAAVLIEGEVTPVVQAIFDHPVPADEFCQSIHIGFRGQQTGNAIGDLFASGPVWEERFAFDGEDLSRVGEIDFFGLNGSTD